MDLLTVQELELVIYSSLSHSANTSPALTCWQNGNIQADHGEGRQEM